MKGCATLSIIRLFQLLMLPTFICLGWNFPCWVSPSGWISWESFNKNTWTIQGNEKRGKTVFCSCLLKLLQALDSEITASMFFGAGNWIIRKVERVRKAKIGVEEISLERVCSCLMFWTAGKKANKPHAFQNRVNEWLGAEWSSLFHCTSMMYWFEGERITRCKQTRVQQKRCLKCSQWWNKRGRVV